MSCFFQKQVNETFHFNCSGLWESKQKHAHSPAGKLEMWKKFPMGSCQKSVFACSPKVRNSWDEMSHSLASAKNNSCYLFALFMLYLYVSTEMERVFNLKQVHRPIQLNCSGLWESKQKKYFDNTPFDACRLKTDSFRKLSFAEDGLQAKQWGFCFEKNPLHWQDLVGLH